MALTYRCYLMEHGGNWREFDTPFVGYLPGEISRVASEGMSGRVLSGILAHRKCKVGLPTTVDTSFLHALFAANSGKWQDLKLQFDLVKVTNGDAKPVGSNSSDQAPSPHSPGVIASLALEDVEVANYSVMSDGYYFFFRSLTGGMIEERPE